MRRRSDALRAEMRRSTAPLRWLVIACITLISILGNGLLIVMAANPGPFRAGRVYGIALGVTLNVYAVILAFRWGRASGDVITPRRPRSRSG